MRNVSPTAAYTNNTGTELSTVVHNEIMSALREARPLSEEISDLITLEVVEVGDGSRGIVDWA